MRRCSLGRATRSVAIAVVESLGSALKLGNRASVRGLGCRFSTSLLALLSLAFALSLSVLPLSVLAFSLLAGGIIAHEDGLKREMPGS